MSKARNINCKGLAKISKWHQCQILYFLQFTSSADPRRLDTGRSVGHFGTPFWEKFMDSFNNKFFVVTSKTFTIQSRYGDPVMFSHYGPWLRT